MTLFDTPFPSRAPDKSLSCLLEMLPVPSDQIPPETDPNDAFEIISMITISIVSSIMILFVVKPYLLKIPFTNGKYTIWLDFGTIPPLGVLVLLATTTIDGGRLSLE